MANLGDLLGSFMQSTMSKSGEGRIGNVLQDLQSNLGSMVGAAVLVSLPELLRFVGLPGNIAAQMRDVIYGALIVIVINWRPQGLLGRARL